MSPRYAAAEADTREDPVNNVEAECRKAGCGARTPHPMTMKEGNAWMANHGQEAHGNPYLGAKWTSVREPREPRDAAQRTYVTEISVPRLGDDGTQRLHSPMPDPEPPATAADVLAVLQGETTGPEAGAALASYFAPGPEPRYDTRQAQAQAQAEAEAGS